MAMSTLVLENPTTTLNYPPEKPSGKREKRQILGVHEGRRSPAPGVTRYLHTKSTTIGCLSKWRTSSASKTYAGSTKWSFLLRI